MYRWYEDAGPSTETCPSVTRLARVSYFNLCRHRGASLDYSVIHELARVTRSGATNLLRRKRGRHYDRFG